MRTKPLLIIHRITLFLGVMLVGCADYTGSDAAEQKHPDIKKAAQLLADQDLDGAASVYRALLLENPEIAQAHLQLGMIFGEQQDFIRSIYHLQEYLDLRPDANPEKRQTVEQMIVDGTERLPGRGELKIPDLINDGGVPLSEVETLKRKNEGLRRETQLLRNQITTLITRVEDAAAGEGATEAAVTKPVSASGRSYTVRPGDSLSGIAKKMYPDSDADAWQKIYNANKSQLRGGKDRLRVGQTLNIP